MQGAGGQRRGRRSPRFDLVPDGGDDAGRRQTSQMWRDAEICSWRTAQGEYQPRSAPGGHRKRVADIGKGRRTALGEIPWRRTTQARRTAPGGGRRRREEARWTAPGGAENTAQIRRRADGAEQSAEPQRWPRWTDEAEAATTAKERRRWPRRQAGELAAMAAQRQRQKFGSGSGLDVNPNLLCYHVTNLD